MVDTDLRLNFYPIDPQPFTYTIYVAPTPHNLGPLRGSGLTRQRLRSDLTGLHSEDVLVSFSRRHDFQEVTISARDSLNLTKTLLLDLLSQSVASQQGTESRRSHFRRELYLSVVEHPQGWEQLILYPYYAASLETFGVVVDFHFRKRREIQFNRDIQRLSLSLDSRFRRNLNFYVDKNRKITDLFDRFVAPQLPLRSDVLEQSLTLTSSAPPLTHRRLIDRTYVAGSGRGANNQYAAIKQHGPRSGSPNGIEVVFLFREQDRGYARKLARALAHPPPNIRQKFPGFRSLFREELLISSDPIILSATDRLSLHKAVADLATRARESTEALIPVVVGPHLPPLDYNTLKAEAMKHGLAVQVCTDELIGDDRQFGWSLANIALQIFCKAGGTPWTIQPSAHNSLVVGVSQSHRFVGEGEQRTIVRHYAFSVLTDNTGQFQRIEVLADTDERSRYIESLKSSLSDVLQSGRQDYDSVVVHASFRLSSDEISALKSVVREFEADEQRNGCVFAVLRLNDESRFFGFDYGTSSLVPLEGTVGVLGEHEYLIWLEGLDPKRRTVQKAYPGPLYLEVLSTAPRDRIDLQPILQDVLNLSGVNWRGFNARARPSSTYYCSMVARRIREFYEFDLPIPSAYQLSPWFI